MEDSEARHDRRAVTDAHGEEATGAGGHAPWQRAAAVGLVVASVAASLIGSVFLPVLLRTSPAGLLAVLSSYPQMALARPRIDPVTFIAVASLRRWAGEVAAFTAGRVLGEDALRWFTRRSSTSVRMPEGVDTRWRLVRDAVVVVVPSPWVGALLGLSGIGWKRYALLKLIGSVASVAVIWWLAGAADGPLDTAAGAVEANALTLTGALALLAVVWLWAQRRNGRSDEDEG